MKPRELTQLHGIVSVLKNKGLSTQGFFDLISFKKKSGELLKDIHEGFVKLMGEYGVGEKEFQIGWNPDGSMFINFKNSPKETEEIKAKVLEIMNHDMEIPTLKLTNEEIFAATKDTDLSMEEISVLM